MIQLVDLNSQYQELKAEIDNAIENNSDINVYKRRGGR